MDAKFFSSIKKCKKSNAISFKSVPLDIKIDVFSVKKEHTFSGFPHISRTYPKRCRNIDKLLPFYGEIRRIHVF